jgi:integrase
MVLCAIVMSMNVAELCGLQWKRVNICPEWTIVDGEALPPFHIAVRRQFRLGEPTTLKRGSRKRNVALPALLAESFALPKQRPQFTGPYDPVFASRNGTPLDQPNISNRVFKRAGSKLGMPWLSWHCFRRTTATMADQLGMGTGDRKGLLGHSTAAMATLHVQKDADRHRAALEELAGRLVKKDDRIQ